MSYKVSNLQCNLSEQHWHPIADNFSSDDTVAKTNNGDNQSLCLLLHIKTHVAVNNKM